MADQIDQADGALSSTYQAPSGRDIAHNLAYGGNDSSMFQGALAALMDPQRSKDTEDKAFWAGASGPHNAPGQGVSSGLKAQVEVRDAQDKLRAAYIPMIMQAMTQQRANDLGYAKFGQERAEKITPMINSALYGMQANGGTPDLAAAHKRIDEVGGMFGMSPNETLPHHLALHSAAGPDGSKLGEYLQQLRVAAAPAAEGLPKFGTNAAGQTVTQNPVKGTVGAPGTEDGAVNPTKTAIELDKSYRGDPGKYTDDLAGTLAGYNDMLNRGNSINEALASFTPGRYSKNVGGVAAATKDLARMFPNVTTKTINDYVTSLMGTRGDGSDANPVAAQQYAESLKTNEALAQLKTTLEGQGRIGQQEFRSIQNSMTGSPSDPAAFNKFMSTAKGRAANVTNKLKAWGDYSKSAGDKISVPAFEIPWSVNEATQLVGGQSGQLDTPPGTRDQPIPNNTVPRASTINAAPPAPTSAQPPQTPKEQVNLADYEPGARVGPTGVVYVIDHGVPRHAKARGVSGQITQ